MKYLQIAVGIIRNEQGDIFISQRGGDSHLAGLWEFPGGKIESGESPYDGLVRELAEETGINVQQATLLSEQDYQFDDRSLTLYFYLVEQWNHQPYGKEGQPTRWVNQRDLKIDEFPESNRQIIEQLQRG